MRALVTNDDGITSPGLHALARAARDAGFDVTVAAPSWDSSGASASLTSVEDGGRLVIQRPVDGALAGFDAVAVHAAPAYIVRAAVHGAFGPRPDVVLSGINLGPNLGQAILHSGTVGAALTGATFGCSAAAFSIGAGVEPVWSTAEEVARQVLGWLRSTDGPSLLNVNIPSRPATDLRGVRRAPLASFGAVQTHVTDTGEGYVKLEYVERDIFDEPGTDAALFAEGYVTFTPLSAVCEHVDAATPGLETLMAQVR